MEFFIAFFGIIWLMLTLSKEHSNNTKYEIDKRKFENQKKKWADATTDKSKEEDLQYAYESLTESYFMLSGLKNDVLETFGKDFIYRLERHAAEENKQSRKYNAISDKNYMDAIGTLLYANEGMYRDFCVSIGDTCYSDGIIKCMELAERRLREHGKPAYFICKLWDGKIDNVFSNIKAVQDTEDSILSYAGYVRLWGRTH